MAVDVKALLEKQKLTLDSVEPVTQEVLLGDEVVGVRFWPVSGRVWRELAARHPSRGDSGFDIAIGYDLDGVLRDYPRTYIVDGDDVQAITGEQWAEVCDVLSGPDLRNLAIALWGLNDYDPAQRLAAAGKARTGRGKKKRS